MSAFVATNDPFQQEMFVSTVVAKCGEKWRDTWVRVEYRNLCPCDKPTKTVTRIQNDDDEFEELLCEHEIEKGGILSFKKRF